MIDINQLRKDTAGIVERLASRGYAFNSAKFQDLEAQRKEIQTITENLQARRNALSKEIGILKSKGQDASAVLAEVASIPEHLKKNEEQLALIQQQLNDFLLQVPNLPHATVPLGASSDDNQEVKRWGQPQTFDFAGW